MFIRAQNPSLNPKLTTAFIPARSRPRLRSAGLTLCLALAAISAPSSAQQIRMDNEFISTDTSALFTPSTAPQAAYQTQPMRFSEIEERLRQHPSLEALTLTASAQRSRADGALGLPDPVVSLQLNNVPFLNPSLSEYLPSNKAVGVKQAFPSRSERKANSLKSLRSAAVSELEREQNFRVMRGRVIALLTAKAGIETRRDLAKARAAKYDELTEIIDIEINAGRPLLFRLAQVDIERSEVTRSLSDLDREELEINAELVNLLGAVPETTLPALNKISLSGNALQFYGVRAADLSVDVSDAEVQKAEADFKPDWGVNLVYQQRESGQGPRSNFDGDDWVSGGVTFTVPLWAGKRQEPNLRAAKTDKQAAMARRTSIARQLQSDWLRYDARQAAAQQNIKIYEAKIKAIKEKTAAQLISYESGAGDYSPILDGEIAVLMLQSEIVKETTQRGQLIAVMNSLLVTS